MRTTTSTKLQAGFTLVETALAIGLLAALILPILGLLTAGAAEAGKAQVHRQTSRVREDIRLRLQDPAWLAAGRTWETTLKYDRKGRLIEDNEHLPSMTVRLQGMQAPGFRSDRFEAVKIRVHNAKTNRLLDEAVVQRRKETTT